jgi:hypothetical protein
MGTITPDELRFLWEVTAAFSSPDEIETTVVSAGNLAHIRRVLGVPIQ